AFLNRRQEMLAAVLDPFDRPAEQAGSKWHDNFFRINEVFGAEPAADIRRDDTKLIIIDVKQVDERHAYFMRALGRRPQRRAVLDYIVMRENAPALNRMRAAAMLGK